jgi:hypothetical protein
MSKEVRAVVFGLVVVVLAALAVSFWRGPAREFHRIRSFHVDVKKRDGDEIRRMSFNVPVTLLAQLTRIAHLDDAFDRDIRRAWDSNDITPREILDAADESDADKPGIIKKDDKTIEVRTAGDQILIDVRDEPDETVHIALPRHLVEVFAEDHPLSTRDLMRRLDELNPGDPVTIRHGDDEVVITAEPKKKGLQVSWMR